MYVENSNYKFETEIISSKLKFYIQNWRYKFKFEMSELRSLFQNLAYKFKTLIRSSNGAVACIKEVASKSVGVLLYFFMLFPAQNT